MKIRFKRLAIVYSVLIYLLLSFYFFYKVIKAFFMSIASIFVNQSTFDNWVDSIDENLSEYGIK